MNAKNENRSLGSDTRNLKTLHPPPEFKIMLTIILVDYDLQLTAGDGFDRFRVSGRTCYNVLNIRVWVCVGGGRRRVNSIEYCTKKEGRRKNFDNNKLVNDGFFITIGSRVSRVNWRTDRFLTRLDERAKHTSDSKRPANRSVLAAFGRVPRNFHPIPRIKYPCDICSVLFRFWSRVIHA